MKKIVFASTISILLSLAVVAQTPALPPRAAVPNSMPSTAASGGVGAEGKIAHVNATRFSQGIFELKTMIDALNAEFEPQRKEIQTADEELNKLKNKIQTQSSAVSQQVRNQWAEEVAEKEKSLKRKAEDYEALAQKRYTELSQPLNEKILKFLASYCQSHGIAIVFERSVADQTGTLIWYSAATDITDDFIKEYNKAYPVAASSPAGTKRN